MLNRFKLKKPTYKRYIVKIPKDVLIIYSDFNGHILFKKNNKVVCTRTLFRLKFLNSQDFCVTPEVVGYNNDSKSKKKIKECLSTQVSILKQNLADVSTNPYKKLIFVGLGYKFLLIKNNLRLLRLKLGYSHDIYVKAPSSLDFKWYNQNSLYVSGTSTVILSNFVTKIKDFRTPDQYLGKGVLFINEKIILKKGKQA